MADKESQRQKDKKNGTKRYVKRKIKMQSNQSMTGKTYNKVINIFQYKRVKKPFYSFAVIPKHRALSLIYKFHN